MNKILVIGCPGAGKSYFSNKLSEISRIPVYHLDCLFWKENWVHLTRDELKARLKAIYLRESWIIDGNYSSTLEERFAEADTIIYLDIKEDICIQSETNRRGKPRSDLPSYLKEEYDPEFVNFIKNFKNNDALIIKELMEKYKDKEYIVFKDRNEEDEFLKNYSKSEDLNARNAKYEENLSDIILVSLTKDNYPLLVEMMDEWKEYVKVHDYELKNPGILFHNDLSTYEKAQDVLNPEILKVGQVKSTTLFAYDKRRQIFVGAVNIRHELNDGLFLTGGHIGDGIRPFERRKGFGTQMIKLALNECKKLGIKRVLITCNEDNIGSMKSIIKNGGIFENQVEEEGHLVNRYWINL